MSTIKKFDTFQAFLDYNSQTILENYFTYYHVISLLDYLESGQLDLYDAYNVMDGEVCSVICLWVTGNYFVYSNSWNEDIIKTLQDTIQIARFKDFHFIGSRDLILRLFESHELKYSVFKERLIYECEQLLPSPKPLKGRVQNASYEDLDELVEMSMDNYTEEYSGQGQKTLADMESAVAHGIQQTKLFLLRDRDMICSLAQVINDDESHAMIGNLYTKKEMRNKGYAFFLLYTITEGLLKNGIRKCGLLSDMSNIASNKVFVNVGYKPIYSWVDIFKEGR